MKVEIKSLKPEKASTFMGIPSKVIIDVCDVLSEPLSNIWNEIIKGKKFPSKLKLADISPIFKKLDDFLVGNYRPVSILPAISKIFERVMQKQVNKFVEKFLSPFLCGNRKGFNSQYALLVMIEKREISLDNHGFAGYFDVTALARMVKSIPLEKAINEGFYRIPVLILFFNMDVLFKESEQEN